MKKLLLSIILALCIWITTADNTWLNTKLETYNKLIKANIITTWDAINIHNNLVTNENCDNERWRWYITLEGSKLIKIWINYCNQIQLKYLLIHEIWHRVYLNNKKEIPLIQTEYLNRYTGEVYNQEQYAESLATLYYK